MLPLQDSHDSVGCARIQASRRLVEEKKARRDNEFHADVRPLALAARHSTNELRTNLQYPNSTEIRFKQLRARKAASKKGCKKGRQ